MEYYPFERGILYGYNKNLVVELYREKLIIIIKKIFLEYNEWLDVNVRSSTPYSGTVNNVWLDERMV